MVLTRLARAWRGEPTSVSMLDGYARWAPRYPPRPHNAVMEAEAGSLGPLVAATAPRVALDVGTGTGRNIDLLHSAGARRIVGIDLSPAMLAHGRHQWYRVCGNAQELPFRGATFDLVCSSLMCGDIADLDAWIREASRVVTRGGHVVYSDFHPSWSFSGWRRTFVGDDGRSYELPFFSHAIREHVALLERHGLEVRAIQEPGVPGKSDPVVAVFHAVRVAQGQA